ncbi:MAG: transposase [Candidatus Peribacteraceae bacterium]|nr:transposase [Candidatus Peribacteraceae bacterium]
MSSPITKRQGAYLPHWTQEGGIYSVRFRLADSLPREKLDELRWSVSDLINTAKNARRTMTAHERLELLKIQTTTMERYLRAGYGSCALRQDRIATIVATALQFFNEKRYRLYAWCVMPNHVHVVVQPLSRYALPEILHSWKSFTAKESNKILGRTGAFWQREYFDRLIRNDDELRQAVEYVWSNAELAGIRNWRWCWKADDAMIARAFSGLEARTTMPADGHATSPATVDCF